MFYVVFNEKPTQEPPSGMRFVSQWTHEEKVCERRSTCAFLFVKMHKTS